MQIKYHRVLAALALSWGFAVSGPLAHAAVSCGTTLGPGGSFTLDGDLSCGSPGPAITLISASLNLNGHTVSCTDPTIDGIVIDGIRAKLTNGTVTGCHDGVVIGGKGRHTVSRVKATANADIGISELAVGPDGHETGSFRNNILNNTATNNGTLTPNHDCGDSSCCDSVSGDGFSLDGGSDIITGNTATGNFDTGFEIDSKNNRIQDNTSDNNKAGTILCGGPSGPVTCVPSEGFDCENGGDGFHIGGSGNRLRRNEASGNADSGFTFQGDHHMAWDNTSTGNHEDGFTIVTGIGGIFTHNTGNNNTARGFAVIGGSNHSFFNNTANGNDDGFSMYRGDGSNVLEDNKADGNEEGFKLVTDRNALRRNTATNNSVGFNLEAAVEDQSDVSIAEHNLLDGNTATNNNTGTDQGGTNGGILVEQAATDNTIVNNTVSGSAGFDLEDDNPDCDNNTWKNNTFSTSSSDTSCIQ